MKASLEWLKEYSDIDVDAVKLAWNQISEYIQMMILNGNASLAILDSSNKVIMALDKEGQNFYKNGETEPFGEMGIKTVDNQNYISFSVLGEYGQSLQDGMAWGITLKNDNKFIPILYIKDFQIGDQVIVAITKYNYTKKQIYGKIVAKW